MIKDATSVGCQVRVSSKDCASQPTLERGLGAWHPAHRVTGGEKQIRLPRWWVLRAFRRPRTAAQKSLRGQPASSDCSSLTDDHLGVAAAGRAKPALAGRKQLVPDDLVGADAGHEDSGAQLLRRRPIDVDHQHREKHDGDGEHRPPPPIVLLRRLRFRTYRQTR